MAVDFRAVPLWGLRCPSEVLALRWGDIDWERSLFTVRSAKTEHQQGKTGASCQPSRRRLRLHRAGTRLRRNAVTN